MRCGFSGLSRVHKRGRCPAHVGNSRVPSNFLPRRMLQNISALHEAMSAQNRAISTCTLVSMLRYLMSELSQTLDTANAIARTERDDEVQVEVPEEEDDNLLMQTFFLTDGKDSKEGKWSRAILRLQKELMAQPRQGRWAESTAPAVGDSTRSRWRVAGSMAGATGSTAGLDEGGGS